MVTFNKIDVRVNEEGFLYNPELQEATRLKKQRESSLLGKDIKMLGIGNFFRTRKKFPDIDVAFGITNLAQATTHRLITVRGTHPEDAGFGVPWGDFLGVAYVSKGDILTALGSEITEELLKDERVSRVSLEDLFFEDPNTVRIVVRVENIAQDYALISLNALGGG